MTRRIRLGPRPPVAVKYFTCASQRGGSLTKAVSELLDRGLTVESDERSIAELELNLARVTSEKCRQNQSYVPPRRS
jgi:hypothetical protein